MLSYILLLHHDPKLIKTNNSIPINIKLRDHKLIIAKFFIDYKEKRDASFYLSFLEFFGFRNV